MDLTEGGSLDEKPRRDLADTTYLADTRDLLLREAETRQLAVAAASGGARRAVLRAVARRPGGAGGVSVLHRAARRRVPGQGRRRALGAVVAGGGAENVRATGVAAATTGRGAHRAPVTSGATVGHHGCVIAGVHHDPPHRGTALHRAADPARASYPLRVRDRMSIPDGPRRSRGGGGAQPLPLTRRSSSAGVDDRPPRYHCESLERSDEGIARDAFWDWRHLAVHKYFS